MSGLALLGILVAREAAAAPSAALCEQWRTALVAQARELASVDHRVDATNLKVSSARVDLDDITASVRDGVCRVRAAGRVDLTGKAQVTYYGMSTGCSVHLARAPVVTGLDISGTREAPDVVRSAVDLEGLKPNLSICLNVDFVKGVVVDVASDYLGRQLPGWHDAIERSLARR